MTITTALLLYSLCGIVTLAIMESLFEAIDKVDPELNDPLTFMNRVVLFMLWPIGLFLMLKGFLEGLRD